MTSPVADIVKVLKERLTVLDAERTYILALLGTYGEEVQTRGHGLSAYSAPSFPPVPDSEKVRLVKDANGRSGISKVIIDVARKYPGLDMTQLANRVSDYIVGDVPESRDGLRNMIKYQVDTTKLIRRDGRYYVPVETEQPDEEATLM